MVEHAPLLEKLTLILIKVKYFLMGNHGYTAD
jgi:hypothetical protein